MKSLYFECYSGISGDMTVGALLDLGADEKVLREALTSLNISGYKIEIKKTLKSGIAATDFDVILDECAHEHKHEHEEDHHHEHAHSDEQRNIIDIYKIIDSSSISDNAKAIAKKAFDIIAKAEGEVHGCKPEEVHFHEVGAIDSIVDIVATAICIDNLGISKVYSSSLFEGTGYVKCQHGLMPVPAPATAKIMSMHNVPIKITNNQGEMVTPTGAAIIAGLCGSYILPSIFSIIKTGVGSGKKEFKQANILRVHLIEDELYNQDEITVLETNIDDSTPESLGFAFDVLMKLGAKDVFFTPVYSKKNRPSYKITVLCEQQDENKLTKALFEHTTTIGVRKTRQKRTVMNREFKKITTKYGEAIIKHCTFEDISRDYIEYESAKELAENNQIPLYEVIREVNLSLDK